jgi:hypothetical protein
MQKFNFHSSLHNKIYICRLNSSNCAPTIQRDQKEDKSEQALQIIGHVVTEFYANKRSMHGRRQFVVSNATFNLILGVGIIIVHFIIIF